jgi:diguanylate cyclase (GGDEF)-like protein
MAVSARTRRRLSRVKSSRYRTDAFSGAVGAREGSTVHGASETRGAAAEPVRVLLVGASESDAARVRDLLARSAAMRFALSAAPSLDALPDPLASACDVLLLRVDASDLPDLASVTRARSAASRVPLVALADDGDEAVALRALHNGARGFLVSSELGTRSLVTAIAGALENRRMNLQLDSARERARHLATHDPLTGLVNRALFHDRLAQAMFAAHRANESLAVLSIDLDGLKTINDTLGHAVGDGLLRSLARRIGVCLRPTDTAARLGGDEFAVLLQHLRDDEDAGNAAFKLLAELSEPIHFRSQLAAIECSIGVAMLTADTRDPEELMRQADTAMDHAKQQGGGAFVIYRGEMGAAAQKRQSLEESLRKSLDDGDLRVHYQPIYDLSRGRIIGAEALVRWQHPELGLLAPAEFLPIAEETGLILPLGTWILRAACAQCADWARAGHRGLRVSVNVAAQQFLDPAFADHVRAALDDGGLPAPSLELEIVEGSLLRDVNATVDTLARLKELGVRIAVDDFGTGYSALAYLKQLPLDVLKIDQSFVQSVTTDPADATITETIVKLAAGLNLTTIAEGVETLEQLLLLGSYGCKRMQGFLFGKPVPPDVFASWLEDPPFRWVQGGIPAHAGGDLTD